jgi:hypothetical protein
MPLTHAARDPSGTTHSDMNIFEGHTFVATHDTDSSAVFEHAAFRRCTFVNCTLSTKIGAPDA